MGKNLHPMNSAKVAEQFWLLTFLNHFSLFLKYFFFKYRKKYSITLKKCAKNIKRHLHSCAFLLALPATYTGYIHTKLLTWSSISLAKTFLHFGQGSSFGGFFLGPRLACTALGITWVTMTLPKERPFIYYVSTFWGF